VHEDAVGEAARLEVALEREQRVGGRLQALRERARLVGVRVVMPGAVSETTRSGRPAPSIAARPASRFGNASDDTGYATGLVNPGFPSTLWNGSS
jgi:hypothetical protein